MSLRYFSVRLFRNGRYLLQKYIYTGKHNVNISEESVSKTKSLLERGSRVGEVAPRQSAIRNVGYAVGLQARRLFIENVLCKVNHGFNNHVKKQVTNRLFFGDAAPLFAFMGVSLASGSGFLSRQDELEGLCWEIRNAVSKFQWSILTDEQNEPAFIQEEVKLSNLTVGNLIAKGCSAVVYAAKLNDKTQLHAQHDPRDAASDHPTVNGHFNCDNKGKSPKTETDISEYPLALKMMFNYDVQSNSLAILRAMYQETIPARRILTNNICFWEDSLRQNKLVLPPHPNIVAMYAVFADYMPKLPGSMQVYPDALPSAFNPDGSGRNMTLFLLMKRYQYSLADFLKKHPPAQRDSVLLLAQLLEGIAHMNLHGIAHRDLKSDNILVDQVDADDSSVPVLVITDFGCCLADKTHGLEIPYKSDQMDKGGNMTLMAPEVILQTPGTFSILNYSKSDLWAAGTIAYEIFGKPNPFYISQNNGNQMMSEVLRNVSYKETQLPSLEENTPTIIRKLIENMLKRNPNLRLSAEVASNICQLFLWAPSSWIRSNWMPSNQEILQWLFCLTTKVLCEGRLSNQSCEGDSTPLSLASPSTPSSHRTGFITKKSVRRSHPEYILISNFLCRAKLVQIKQAISWIQANNA